ncbi:MAG: TRAP transporter small permease [Treponema sp.]|uniref:TRAP transporter small permease n=1 Tax=Treponema sp. TaxID=166 RepID=UPI0025D47BAA|nr:TRAP transporter small permease [Treponema sp.]MBQ9282861.1 TRAP transporter small permease [Treponema sp.]
MNLIEKIKGFFTSAPAEICKPGFNTFQKIISAFTFVFDCIYRVLLEFSKLVILVIVIIVSCEVFARLVLHHSIMWSEEVALLLMVWTAFIAMAIGVEKGLHISISLFFNMFPKICQKIIEKLNTVAAIFFGGILLIYGIKLTSMTMTSTLPATQLPAGTAYMMMPVGGIFIMYFAILDLFGAKKYRHLSIEGEAGSDKTDQQIIEEMRASKKENAVTDSAETEGGDNV